MKVVNVIRFGTFLSRIVKHGEFNSLNSREVPLMSIKLTNYYAYL
jgi:hypothetical protein